MPVFAGIVSVQTVVGCHDGCGLCCFYDIFKGTEIDFPKRPFVNLTVGGLTVGFLIVAGEMLQGYCNALCLHGLYIGGSHTTG